MNSLKSRTLHEL